MWLRSLVRRGAGAIPLRRGGANRFLTGKSSWWAGASLALLSVAVVALAKVFLAEYLSRPGAFLLFPIAVIVAAWRGGFAAGMLATISSAVLIASLFLPRPGVLDPAHLAQLAEFLLEGGVISTVMGLLSAAEGARDRALETERGARLQAEQSEESLRWEELRKGAIMESALDGIVTMDDNGRIVDFNAAAERIFGYRAGEVHGKTVAEILIPERFRDQHRRGLERFLLRGEGPVLGRRIEVTARRWNDEEFPAELAIATTRLPGVRAFFTAYIRDITERKQSEEALRESAERFRFMAESMPQKIFTTKANGEVDYVNEQWTEFTGIPNGRVRDWTDFIHPEEADESVSRWQHCLLTGKPFQQQQRFRSQGGGYRWHLTRAHGLRDAAGKIVMWIGSHTDIDEQKRAEEKLTATVAERTASLRETIGQLEAFSYAISHDMRAPLRSMQQFSQILLDEHAGQLDPTGKRFLERIASGAHRLDQLIQDVLTYSRMAREEIELKPIDLDPLTREIIDHYPNLQPPHAEIRVEQLPRVMASMAPLTQCLSNLLGNAVKFVPAGRKPQITVRAERRGDFVRLWVEDNGIGIAPRDQERIFGIFARVHSESEYEGTGIGLSIVKKAAQRMGGRAGVESILGTGSRFWIELKAVPE